MEKADINEKIESVLKSDVKFVILLGGVITSILVPYFSTREIIIQNQLRIKTIEAARAEVWSRQEKVNDKTTQCIERLDATLYELTLKIK